LERKLEITLSELSIYGKPKGSGPVSLFYKQCQLLRLIPVVRLTTSSEGMLDNNVQAES
jgi:hypothetical protein